KSWLHQHTLLVADSSPPQADGVFSAVTIKKYRNKKIIEYYLKLLNYITTLKLDITILNKAGLLASVCYNREESKKDEYKRDNDFIIGATVMAHKDSLLLTCNRKDFNRKFWDIEAREHLIFEEDEKMKIENIFVLKFNHSKFTENTK
ncbi:MAG: hypothetical protein NUV54_03415, partial [Candidatus Taylorbacteria bacterium]|nr:hypothetical protein [Candidatus Taylorbacteria bacterium]